MLTLECRLPASYIHQYVQSVGQYDVRSIEYGDIPPHPQPQPRRHEVVRAARIPANVLSDKLDTEMYMGFHPEQMKHNRLLYE